MADTPKLFGLPMKQAHQNGLMWCASGVFLRYYTEDSRWHWSVSIDPKCTVGLARDRYYACRQIERAITRIRNAANRLGT